jgi:hypothetical protein
MIMAAEKPASGTSNEDVEQALAYLELLSDGSRLVAEVYDQAPGMPVIREARLDAEGGRGLMVIAQASRQWGWNPLVGQHGKVVWAELSA